MSIAGSLVLVRRKKLQGVRAALLSGLATGLIWSGPAISAEAAPQVSQSATMASPAAVIMGASGVSVPNFADIVERVSPAVVSITTSKGLGSGFVVDPTGYVVTNNHVIEGSTEFEVRFADGAKFKGKLVGRDEGTDIALLKIETGKQLPSVTFEDDRRVRVGDWVLAVGNPFGLGGTVTAGIVSARGRDEIGSSQFTDYFQVDAAINPGNSGGPTFDTAGRVIGMNTIAINSRSGSGIGFAIPSSTIRRIIDDLKATGSVTRGFLGVQIESLSEDTAKALGLPNANGALVTDVIEGSPAEKSGIRRSDVVLKINGQAVKDNRELSRRIAALQAGETATFTIWRDNKQVNITVTVAKRDRIADDGVIANPEVKLTSLGLGLMTITPEMRSDFSLAHDADGVLITDIDLAGNAAQQGLRPGDRIVAVGSGDVKSMADVNLAIEQAKSLKHESVLVFIVTKAGAKAHLPIKLNAN